MPAISIVIPTLNEAAELPETLRRASAVENLHELIVVDAGSTDATQDIARKAGCTILECDPSRGRQLRLGAQHASGDIILLLHADTWLPADAGQTIVHTLAQPGVIAGAFYKRFRDRGALPGSRLRCWLLWKLAKKFFGDQAIFIRRNHLESLGGVPHVPLMEDYELSFRAAKSGRLALAPATVLTTARKFRVEGMTAVYSRMIQCNMSYWLGASPESLLKVYSPNQAA